VTQNPARVMARALFPARDCCSLVGSLNMEPEKKQKKSKKHSKVEDSVQINSALPPNSNIGKKGKKINLLISMSVLVLHYA
jgi:hypothetical protein